MQTVSQLWQTLSQNPEHLTEFKIGINSVDYYSDTLISAESSCDIFNGSAPVVGQCISTQMRASLYLPNNSIQRRAECKLYSRLVLGSTASEWIEQGTYYIDKRRTSKDGRLTIETYDAMRKADKLMYVQEGQQDTWPKTDIDVVEIIAEDYLGVEIHPDTLTEIDQEYEVQYPGYGDGGFTARQVLGYIGAMYAGNWIIDDCNRLKLLKLIDFPHTQGTAIHEITDDLAADYDRLIQFQPISRVTINVGEDESTGDPIYYTSGNDTGEEFEIDCPWGTQDMADTLVSELSTLVYYPYTLTDVVIDPAFELWDGVSTNGIYTGITCYKRYFDPLYTSDISSTGEDEIDSEYPYQSQADLKAKQSTAKTRARLIVQNNRITSEVETINGTITGLNQTLSSKIDQTADNITFSFNEALSDHAATQATYIRYDQNGITIGKSDDASQVFISNTDLEFLNGGVAKAYIGLDMSMPAGRRVYKFFITNGHIVNELEVGDNWSIIDNKTDGHFTIKRREDVNT